MRKIAAFVALSSTACQTMKVEHAPTTAVLSDQKGREIRVRLASGERVHLYEAMLVGDSIVGYTAPKTKVTAEFRSVATADVKELAVAKFSPIRTILALGAMTAAVAIIVAGTASSPQPSNNTDCQPTTAAAPAAPFA